MRTAGGWREVLLPTSSLGLRRGVLLTSPWGLWKGQDRFRKEETADGRRARHQAGLQEGVQLWGSLLRTAVVPALAEGLRLKSPLKGHTRVS